MGLQTKEFFLMTRKNKIKTKKMSFLIFFGFLLCFVSSSQMILDNPEIQISLQPIVEEKLQIGVPSKEDNKNIKVTTTTTKKDENNIVSPVTTKSDIIPSEQNSPKARIEQIVYINLNKRTDRREAIEKELSKYSIPFSRKAAHQFSSLKDAKSDSHYGPYFQKRELAPGVESKRDAGFIVSVYLSHTSTYEYLASIPHNDKDNHYYLVMEDDYKFVPDWQEIFAREIQYVPADFDLLRISSWGEPRAADLINDHVYSAKLPFREIEKGVWHYGGAHAVVVQSSTLRNLMAKMEAIPITDIDEMMTNCCDRIKSYVLKGQLLVHNGAKSDHPYRRFSADSPILQ
eukprot:c4941_g1_i1.p1 GENE.c4941_g1_i1~~c4941_g1_i1.p1  ORF type:complete len:344 (-),score=81.52 c4941_g1_i1:44-1075(-)